MLSKRRRTWRDKEDTRVYVLVEEAVARSIDLVMTEERSQGTEGLLSMTGKGVDDLRTEFLEFGDTCHELGYDEGVQAGLRLAASLAPQSRKEE